MGIPRFILKQREREKLHTRTFSLLKVMEVQLKRLGGSHPLCSSQWRIAVPEMEERESERWGIDCSWETAWGKFHILPLLYGNLMVYLKNYHTKRSLGTRNCCRKTKLSPGPPDPSLDGLRAAVIDYWERRSSEEEAGRRRETIRLKMYNYLMYS